VFVAGALQSPPDHRDYIYGQMIPLQVEKLPTSFSREEEFVTPIRNQGSYGTCVGHAAAAIKEWQETKNYGGRKIQMSPLFIYVECKKQDGIPSTEGTYPRVAMSVLQKLGVCKETAFPYSLMKDKFQLPSPSVEIYSEAKDFIIGSYARVQTLAEVKRAIYRDGPVLAGILVFENFLCPDKGGFIPIPKGQMLGGHAICVVGWDDNLKHGNYTGFLRVRNSWGDNWGDKGYCWIPYDFFNGRLDIGMPYWMESWTSVDVILPPKQAKTIVMWLNNQIALVDGDEVLLDSPPVINPKAGRTLIPLRFVAENMGYKVEWDGLEKKITLTKN